MHKKLKLIITRPAYNDMQNIFDYIAQDNINAASKLIEVFGKRFDSIATFPNSGFKPHFSSKDIKVCIVAKHYQIVYAVRNDNLYIQRVLTGYQDICNL